MFYAPHILQLKVDTPVEHDEYGNPVISEDKMYWKNIGSCRCDDASILRQTSINGQMFEYSYHIVYTGIRIAEGNHIRVLTSDKKLRAEGMVIRCRQNNYLNYGEIWV